MRRAVRMTGRFLLWTVLGAVLVMSIAVVASRALGYQSFTVLSGSMEPAIHTGDVVVGRQISPSEARVGDVVTFKDPGDPSRLITHRLVSSEIRGGTAAMVTKGDANNNAERWTVPADGRIGRVAYRLPRAGYLMSWAGSRPGRLLLIVVPAILLGALELIRIWRPERDKGASDGARA